MTTTATTASIPSALPDGVRYNITGQTIVSTYSIQAHDPTPRH